MTSGVLSVHMMSKQTLTDVTKIKSNENLSNEAQIIRMGPNGAGVY